MRILEALVSYYVDSPDLRDLKINETDKGTGRNALHYLSYMANSDMIQLLASTDILRMHILDKFDRTCLHYAVIHGKSTMINTLVLLFKQCGGRLKRAEIDPNYEEVFKRGRLDGVKNEID